MDVFNFDPHEYAARYRDHGWVHVREGVDPEFLAELQAYTERSFGANVVEGRGIAGTKQQALYEFPEPVDFPGHLFDVVATVAGLRRESMTISERHIKAYDNDTPPEVPAHKDRLSSQVSVGLSIVVPPGSCLVLYADRHREVNAFNVSAALRENLAPDELPEVLLENEPELVIDDQPGDVMLFPGSSMWHKRRRAAGAVNLYLKFNDFESDPLGEDPATPLRRTRTLDALRNGSLDGLKPVLARRLDTFVRQHDRTGGEYLYADVWGEAKVRLSEDEFTLLRELDGTRDATAIFTDSSARGRDAAEHERAIRRLAERGVLDLV